MIMQFSSKEELRLFLTRKGDWKAWVKNLKKQGDRIFVGAKILDSEPMTKDDLEELMKGI